MVRLIVPFALYLPMRLFSNKEMVKNVLVYSNYN
jgi:hypothetical protein